MAWWKFQYKQKEVYILARPSKLQPVADYSIVTQYTHRQNDQDLPLLMSTAEAKNNDQYTHKELSEPKQEKQTLVQHRQNTSWEPATVMSQCTSNSYWIMQENGTDQHKVYRRTRTMLKIRCTNIRETRHMNSQSTESEKAEFPMQLETVSSTTLSKIYHRTLSNRLNQILKLLLLLILNQKKGRKLQKLQMYLHLHLHIHLYLHLHWGQSRNSPTLQDPESQ